MRAFTARERPGPEGRRRRSRTRRRPAAVEVHYRKYAFRNASASSDCITITGNSNCAEGETFDVSFDFGLLGSDHANDPTCQATHTHSFLAPAGQTFGEAVFNTGPGFNYGLTVQGSDVVPVHLLDVNGAKLSGGNTVKIFVSSLEDGTGVQGILTADAGAGQHYGGPARCLRISGDDASLVMTFDGTEKGLASKWKPLAPGFKANLLNDSTVLVVANGPQAGGTT
jgi:hypothetical protein